MLILLLGIQVYNADSLLTKRLNIMRAMGRPGYTKVVSRSSVLHFAMVVVTGMFFPPLEDNQGNTINTSGGYNKFIESGKILTWKQIVGFGFIQDEETLIWEANSNPLTPEGFNLLKLIERYGFTGRYVKVSPYRFELLTNVLTKCTIHLNNNNYLLPESLVENLTKTLRYRKDFTKDSMILAQKTWL